MSAFQYPKTSETLSANKRLEVISIINTGGKPLKKRLEAKGIKIPDVRRVTTFSYNRVKEGAVLGSYIKFNLVKRDGKKEYINLTK